MSVLFSLHPFSEIDLDAVTEVVKAAYNLPHSRKDTLRQYLKLQPDGAFVVKDNDTAIGFGAALDYGPFAYIGLMSVHPSMQKRGVGRLLMDTLLTWLAERGCQTVLLDASQAGAPLYLQYGFAEDDRTLDMRQVQNIVLPHTHSERVSRLKDTDFAKLVAFDTTQFGASREALLAAYYTDDPQRVFVTRDTNGDITGYLIAQTRTIGPWVARSTRDAEQLLHHALTLSYSAEPMVFVSAQHSSALALLARYSFTRTRSLSHMRKGLVVERNRATTLYGQASLGFG